MNKKKFDLFLFVIIFFFSRGCSHSIGLIPPAYKPLDRTSEEIAELWSNGNNYPVAGLNIMNGQMLLFAGNSQTLTYLPTAEGNSNRDSTRIYLVYNLKIENHSNDDITLPVSQMYLADNNNVRWQLIFYQTSDRFESGVSNLTLRPVTTNNPANVGQAIMSHSEDNYDKSSVIIIKPGITKDYNLLFGSHYKEISQLPDSIKLHLVTNIGFRTFAEKFSFNRAAIKE